MNVATQDSLGARTGQRERGRARTRERGSARTKRARGHTRTRVRDAQGPERHTRTRERTQGPRERTCKDKRGRSTGAQRETHQVEREGPSGRGWRPAGSRETAARPRERTQTQKRRPRGGDPDPEEKTQPQKKIRSVGRAFLRGPNH